MSLESWVRNGWLEKRESSAQEIRDLLSVTDMKLEDCKLAANLSADSRLTLAYGAALSAAIAVLRAAGYRPSRDGNEHYRTIDALEYTVDPHKRLLPKLQILRKKRNQSSYEVSGRVSNKEAEECESLAVKLRRDAETWIRTHHPELLT